MTWDDLAVRVKLIADECQVDLRDVDIESISIFSAEVDEAHELEITFERTGSRWALEIV